MILIVGKSIHDFAENSSKRIFLIISSDLAHTHEVCGPYGFDPASQPFDDAVGEWYWRRTTNKRGREKITTQKKKPRKEGRKKTKQKKEETKEENEKKRKRKENREEWKVV